MRAWHIVQSRLQSVFRRGRRESDLREELQFHLERETERLVAAGVPPGAARVQALKTFGAVEPTKEACRDARGIALVDTLVRDVRFTWRSFRRTPLVALTIVTTVGLGLGLVAVVFTVLNAIVFRVDAVSDPGELFAVDRQRSTDAEPAAFTRAEYDAFVRETGVFSDVFAKTSDMHAWIDGVKREGHLVSGNFFRVLGVAAARGRALTPADDAPGRPAVMVLSDRAWSQYFGSDPAVVNRTVQLNGASFQIVGVMPPDFRGLEALAAPDFWAPLAAVDRFPAGQGEEAGRAAGPQRVQIIGRLKSGLSRSQALAQLLVWDAQQPRTLASGRPLPKLVLEPRQGTIPLSGDTLAAFVPLFFAFGLILMIGCANVANLLLARGVARQREIGVRLAIGASRRRLVGQLLTESFLLALVSAVLAFGISRVVIAAIVYVAVTTFPPEIGNLRLAIPPADWRVGLFLVAAAMAATVFFALTPALQATRVELVRAMRGEVARDTRPGRARNVLVALQVTGSVLLLICAAIFLRSSWAAATIDSGIHTDNVVSIGVLNEERRAAILETAKSEPLVTSIAASWPGWLGGLGRLPASVELAGRRSTVTLQYVSPEFLDVFGIDLVRGRTFTQTERGADAAVAIVSENVARDLWPGTDPLGQTLRVEPNSGARTDVIGPPPIPTDGPGHGAVQNLLLARTVAIVGVAREVAGLRLGGLRLGGAGVYMPISADAPGTTLTMRVHGDARRARQTIVDRTAAIDPNMADVSTLQTIARAEVYLLGVPFWLTLILGGLALMLTLSGLFSVLSYLVEQRTREIGVRMALGAPRRGVARLVLAQSARPVAIGLLAGGSLTAALAGVLLASPAAAQIGSTVRLFDPIAYTAALLTVVAACIAAGVVPALRAARIHPASALRQE